MRTNHATAELDNVNRQLQLIVELIVPVKQAKRNLWRLVINGESKNSLTASVFGYCDIYNDLYSTITSGPNDNLVGYFVQLDRLNDAIMYFKRIAVVDEQKRLIALYGIGLQKLIEACDEVIMRYTKSILPDELLELCRSTSLISMNTENMQTEHLQRNCTRRASVCMISIHSHASSRRASYCSDLLRGKLKTTIHGIGNRFARSPVFDGKSSPSKNTLALPEMGAYNDHADNNLSSSGHFSSDLETNNYKFLLDAFVILLSRDLDLLFYTFSNELKSLVFIKLAELPLAYIYEEAQELCKAIEQLPHKIDSGKFAFYGLLSIIQWFRKSKAVFIKLYQLNECDRNKLKASFSTVNTAIDTIRQQNQEYIIDDVQLRNHLRTESKKNVLDMFKTYYTKFAHKNFSQKPENTGPNGFTVNSINDLSGLKVDGLIGMDILAHFDIRFTRNQITFSDIPILHADTAIKLPIIETMMGVPIIKLNIGQEDQRVFFDTGAKLSYLSDELLVGNSFGEMDDFYPTIGTYKTNVYKIDVDINGKVETLTFGSLPASLKMLLVLGQAKGIIGSELLNKYSIILSNSSRILLLEPSNKEEPFDQHQNSNSGNSQSKNKSILVPELSFD
ncbi:unnamed protein product [Rotaria sp. Silwood1]|nr:unnamed protein product [Rotaria sp. Silwood1]